MPTPAESTLDLRSMRERVAAEVEAEQAQPEAVLVQREETFVVRYTTPEGRTHESTLVSRIMDHTERIQLARMAAMMAGGPWLNLPLGLQSRIVQLATVAMQLRNPPGWVEEWAQVDDQLLGVLYAQLDDHERRWFRRDGGEGAEGPGGAVVVVAPLGAGGSAHQRG